ncbi:MAG: hypothetical protein ACD_42C00149G0001 [uncultured bacterium]|nr:MAG: hypothetical protein ACD_42C00149G0001 [uncultured bacterium]
MTIQMDCDLQQIAYDFAQSHIAPIAHNIDQTNRFPRELWPQLGRLGLHGLTVEKKYGGSQRGFLAHAIVMEAINRASGSIGLAYAAHSNLCMNQIQHFGTETQKQHYLPKLCTGEWLGALAMSEKEAGSDVLSMKLHAEEKSDHFILNGHKMWITNGTEADVIVVYAKTNPEAGAHGMTCFIVEKTFSGFHSNPKLDKLGMRGCDTSELIFNNCIVPKENVLGKINGGLSILMTGLDYERAVLSAGPLGLMQACLDVMVPYVKTRYQFKKRLGDFQLIQEKIANAYTYYQAAKSYVYATAALCDQKKIKPEIAAGAYLFAAENATKMALDTIQCLGGVGYLNDSPAGRLLRDAKLYEIGAGTTEIRRIVIARELLK